MTQTTDRTTGKPVTLAPGLARVLAPNPSPMTHLGTNSYIVGTDALAVIDPGPDNDRHLSALLAAIGGRPVSHIIVTHSHLDHSPLASVLADRCGAPVLAFGGSDAGRSASMAALAATGFAGGGEGIDTEFAPDQTVANGDQIAGDGWTLDVLHTPGHMGNHIALAMNDTIFTGDLVMGWASSLVSPPDGDLTDFLASCHRLLEREATVLHSGHGDPIDDPSARLRWLINHRETRTAQILDTLSAGPHSVAQLTAALYAEVDPALHPAAARNVFAHLVALCDAGLVSAQPHLQPNAEFSRT